MVTEEGQLYTIEGITAAILMVLTAYFILNSTSILTPGDTHISDMQLEQLGNDVLKMMDTADSFNDTGNNIYENKQSDLEKWLSQDLNVKENRENVTKDFFNKFCTYAGDNQLKLSATIYYWDGANVKPLNFWNPSNGIPPLTNRDHYVTVTRWVYLKDPAWDHNQPKTVLLEVYLWRD